jgi:hypothetical protein
LIGADRKWQAQVQNDAIDPTATLILTDTPALARLRRAEGSVRRLQATCYFTSARKLGIGSAPMSACSEKESDPALFGVGLRYLFHFVGDSVSARFAGLR